MKSTIEKDPDKFTEMLANPRIKMVRDLATAIDAKSPYTRGHSEAVLRYAMALAEEMNLDEDTKDNLKVASFLHNIGIISIPERLLNKPV